MRSYFGAGWSYRQASDDEIGSLARWALREQAGAHEPPAGAWDGIQARLAARRARARSRRLTPWSLASAAIVLAMVAITGTYGLSFDPPISPPATPLVEQTSEVVADAPGEGAKPAPAAARIPDGDGTAGMVWRQTGDEKIPPFVPETPSPVVAARPARPAQPAAAKPAPVEIWSKPPRPM